MGASSRSSLLRSRKAALVALYLLTLWVVVTLVFLLPRALPGDPLSALQDPGSTSYVVDEDMRARLLAYYGLDRPLSEQYVHYLEGIVTGDFGWSIRLNQPVIELIRERLPWTLLLAVPALLLSSLMTLVAGTHSGWRRGSRSDRALIVSFTGLRAIPAFFLGVLAILVFSVRLNWLPLDGAYTPFQTWPTVFHQALDVGRHWLLPMLVLTVELIGARYLLMRNSMVGVVGENYMLVARAKGLPESALKYRHGMRNAILPFLTAFSIQLGLVVTGAIVVETLFVYPGMGRLMFEAVSARDYPVLEAVFLLSAFAVLTANLVMDLMYGRLDPRVRGA
ncbi:MAG: ABC transporter permease [Anaerolineae bacterium]